MAHVRLERVTGVDVLPDGPHTVGVGGLPGLALEGDVFGGDRRRTGGRVTRSNPVGQRLDGRDRAVVPCLGFRPDRRAGTEPQCHFLGVGGDGRVGLPAGALPGGEGVVACRLEPREPPLVAGVTRQCLQLPGHVVGEPADRPPGVGNRTLPADERAGVEKAVECRQCRRRLGVVTVAVRLRLAVCRVAPDGQSVDRVDPEVPPAGLDAGRLQQYTPVVAARPAVGVVRVPDGEPADDRNPGVRRGAVREPPVRLAVGRDSHIYCRCVGRM